MTQLEKLAASIDALGTRACYPVCNVCVISKLWQHDAAHCRHMINRIASIKTAVQYRQNYLNIGGFVQQNNRHKLLFSSDSTDRYRSSQSPLTMHTRAQVSRFNIDCWQFLLYIYPCCEPGISRTFLNYLLSTCHLISGLM